jgi:hypothetical protein
METWITCRTGVKSTVILCNTVYLERAIRCLKEHGLISDENLLQRLSPPGWEHINLTGDYVWRQNTPHFIVLGISDKMPSSAFCPFRERPPLSRQKENAAWGELRVSGLLMLARQEFAGGANPGKQSLNGHVPI